MNSRYLLDHAKVDWQQHNPYSTPYSTKHRDIYWSRGEAIQEKLHVFINQHALDTRGKHVSQFTIVETGFGFGNNFLLAAKRWRELQHHGILNYIAIENAPVSPKDLLRHYKNVCIEGSKWLLEHYPLPFNTSFVLWPARNIRLILLFDNAISALDNLDAKVDAWFLDGFSPSSNTDLWNQKVYGRIFARSKPGATLSTYTVAGKVRHGLANAGFEISKVSGFSGKAEMLIGTRPGQWIGSNSGRTKTAVLGSGIAGMACMEALQRRKVDAELISNADPNAASSIPQLAVYPQLGVVAEKRYRFSLTGNAYTQHQNPLFNRMDLRWHSKDAKLQERMLRIARQFPNDYMAPSEHHAVRFTHTGWLSNRAHEYDRQAGVESIRFTDGQWTVYDFSGNLITQTDQLVIAMGFDSTHLIDLPLIPVRGQALTIKLGTKVTDMIGGDLILIPAADGTFTLGSTYQRNDLDLRPRKSDTASLLSSLTNFLPHASPVVIDEHVGIRATTRDRLPLVGAVPDQPGLFVSTGFGSHGASHARLCGEHIANLICNEPTALNLSQQRMFAVNRFELRDTRSRSQT